MIQGILNNKYREADDALNSCYKAATELWRKLKKLGIDAHIVECHSFIGDDMRGFHQWYYEEIEDVDEIGHYVVRVGEVYIDFTARQFYPDAPYPTIYDELDIDNMWEEWEEFVDA